MHQLIRLSFQKEKARGQIGRERVYNDIGTDPGESRSGRIVVGGARD